MDIIDKIKSLNNYEKSIVLNFLQNKNVIFSKNSNGYFFNIKNDDTILRELNELIIKIYNNRQIVSSYLNKRKLEQENLKLQVDEEMRKKQEEAHHNFLDKLTIMEENIILNIKNKTSLYNTYSEIEWNQYMSKIDTLLKDKVKYPKDGTFYRLNKIIKRKKKKEINENVDDDFSGSENENEEDVVIEEEINNYDIEKTEIEEYNTEEQNLTEINEEELEDSSDDIEDEDTEENSSKDIEYSELIKKVKEKLILKGHVFNRNLECKLVLEEYIK